MWQNLKEIRLLYVEDEDEARKQISKLFENRCREFFIAKDGVEGVEFFKKYLPDIVVTDVSMPRMNGFEMAKEILKLNPDEIIIITTAHSDTELLIKAIELGVKGYVIKPIDPIKLLNTIDSSCENILLKRELKERENLLLKQALLSLKANLIKDIAHHWRQPLNSITLMASSILDDYTFGELTKESLEAKVSKIESITIGLSNLITLFYNNFSDDEIYREFSVEETINKSVLILKPILEELDVEVTVSSEPITLLGNERYFLQMINNILKNSVEIFEERKIKKPSIWISVKNSPKTITIKDNGGGIGDEILNSVVEPYFTTKNILNGVGLGLFISNFLAKEKFNGLMRLKNIDGGLEVRFEIG